MPSACRGVARARSLVLSTRVAAVGRNLEGNAGFLRLGDAVQEIPPVTQFVQQRGADDKHAPTGGRAVRAAAVGIVLELLSPADVQLDLARIGMDKATVGRLHAALEVRQVLDHN